MPFAGRWEQTCRQPHRVRAAIVGRTPAGAAPPLLGLGARCGLAVVVIVAVVIVAVVIVVSPIVVSPITKVIIKVTRRLSGASPG